MSTVTMQSRSQRSRQATGSGNPFLAHMTALKVQPTETTKSDGPSLHRPMEIAISTFVGGILAGALLMARNHVLLGQKLVAVAFLLGAIAFKFVLLAAFLLLTFTWPHIILILVNVSLPLLFIWVAMDSFAKPYALIAAGRGKWSSSYYAVAVTIASILVDMAIADMLGIKLL